NGVGKAVSPADILSKDIKNIVGIAWSSATGAADLNIINVAVGLNVNDNQKVVNDLQNEVSSLKNQIAEINGMLAKLMASPNTVQQPTIVQNTSALPDGRPLGQNQSITIAQDGTNVDYHHLTREEIIEAIKMA